MTLDEAIEWNKGTKEEFDEKGFDQTALAIQLGIEALERVQELRQCTAIDFDDVFRRLPSETERE